MRTVRPRRADGARRRRLRRPPSDGAQGREVAAPTRTSHQGSAHDRAFPRVQQRTHRHHRRLRPHRLLHRRRHHLLHSHRHLRYLPSSRLHVLYIFAGESRKASVKDLLYKMWPHKVRNTPSPRFLELDILRNKNHDMSKKANQQTIFQQIANRDWDIILVPPPCHTWTRAVWSNFNGPGPMRSFDYLLGFPWLPWRTKQTCTLANTLAMFAIEVLDKQLSVGGHVSLEQPEGLGTVRSGPHAGRRPASMWQLPQLNEVLQNTNVEYVCLRQSDFGRSYLKPARLLFTLPGADSERRFFKGPPTFDHEGYYVGPCPASSTSGSSLIGKKGSAFATTGTAAWPPLLCEWIANSICTVANTKPVSDVLSQRGRPDISASSLQTGTGSTSSTSPGSLQLPVQPPGGRGSTPCTAASPGSGATSCTASSPGAGATSRTSSSQGTVGSKFHSEE